MRLSKFYDIDFSFSNLGYDLKIFLISFLCGASVFTAEYFFCLLFNSTFAVMGVQADEIRDVVLANFKSTIILSQLKIILVYIVIGGLVGLCFGYILNLYSIIFKKSFRMLSVILSVLFLCFIASLLFLIIDIFYHPALYNEVFYANVGVLRDIQLYITDRISKFVISFIRYITILIFSPLLIAAIFSIIKRIYKVFALLPLYGRIISAVIVLALTFLLAFSDTGKNQGPNIIILSSDSLRYDRISAYGYKRDITPNIDRLVSEGFSFNNLHAQLPRTFPSWYCLLTGKYPKGHGIRHMFPTREELKACKTDLVEILRNKGYTTSVVADYAGDIFSRMDDYERVNTPYFNFDSMIKQRSLELQFMLLPYIQNRLGRYIFPELRCFAQNSDPEYLKNDVIQELEYLSKKKRFFLTVFFSVTHFPYASPYPYYKMYTENEYKGEYKYLKINDPRSAKVITKEDRRYINALFDGACKSLDDAVGQIIDDLKNKGLYDNSIIIIKSDHGENLYDYGLDIGHGEHFRGEFATHIPLIIKFHKNYAANVKTKNYDGIVEQVDFLPTMLDILG
ncbi:MAG: sulfatase-like hydrolase/transferase, partial [Spirochaetota bacterium]|nr:sulfatase-like hydrolase/transferase [Spirochaetota bacterium]